VIEPEPFSPPYWKTRCLKAEAEVDELRAQVKGWEDWADKHCVLWRAEDVKRFAEIDSRPVTAEEREYSRKALETYRAVMKRSKPISDLVEKDSSIYEKSFVETYPTRTADYSPDKCCNENTTLRLDCFNSEQRALKAEAEVKTLKDDLKAQEEMYAIACRKILDEKCLRADVTDRAEKAEAEVKTLRDECNTCQMHNPTLQVRKQRLTIANLEAEAKTLRESNDTLKLINTDNIGIRDELDDAEATLERVKGWIDSVIPSLLPNDEMIHLHITDIMLLESAVKGEP